MTSATHKALVKIEPRRLTLKSGARVSLRAATEQDVGEVTELIHLSYGYWLREFGLTLTPQTQPVEKTRIHLVGLGYVATDDSGKIVGTFSTDESRIIEGRDGKIDVKFSFAREGVSYTSTRGGAESVNAPVGGRYLEFKKFAVDPSLGKQGLGKQLYGIAESYARGNGFDGVELETVYECRWLYDWYVGMGFEVIGKHRYPGSRLDTLILVKRF